MKTTLISISIIFLAFICACSGNSTEASELYLKGNEAFYKQELKTAESYFNKSLLEDSSLLPAKIMLAKVYYFKKDFSRSLALLDEVLDDDADHVSALYWKARILAFSKNSGESGKNRSREDTAIACLKKILEIDSTHINSRNLLGLIYENQGNYQEALYEYKRALQEEKSMESIRSNLGGLYSRMGLSKKSAEEINRARAIAQLAGFTNSLLPKKSNEALRTE